jgi:SAM-dependent methyltransferase
MTSLEQHQLEIEANLRSWNEKPLLQKIYADFYKMIVGHIDQTIPGQIVELGSGIGNLRAHVPSAICTDLFPNPWLDMACDAYRLPFAEGSVSHLVMFDVFHHLERPNAFFREARRVIAPNGRLILFEPYISLSSFPVYGLLHHEPVAIRRPIDNTFEPPAEHAYYAAQGNATRLFFARRDTPSASGFEISHAEALSSFAYLLSGGYSKRPFYPAGWYHRLTSVDRTLSRLPRVFGGRCLVVLEPTAETR